MAKIPMPEEMIRNIAASVLDVEIDGKTLREWIGILKEYRSTGWISVKDRLPESRDWVLVIGKFVPEGYWIVPHIAEFRNGVWHSDDIDCTPLEERALTVTHWMPLPEPPKEEE